MLTTTSHKNQVLVIGSSNTDMIVRADHLPRPGETVIGGDFATFAGGKGANQAVAAARAGASVEFIARIGTDAWGAMAVAGLQAEGIGVERVVRDPNAPSGVALIMVDRGGENCIAVAPGANDALSPGDVKAAADAFSRAAVVVLQLEIPLETVETAVDLAVATGVRVILNPAPVRDLPDSLLRKVFLLTPNQGEAESLTGISMDDPRSIVVAANRLLERGVSNVVITLGSRGAFATDGKSEYWIPAYDVRAVDATAAGDVFNGALAFAMAEGQPLPEAARFAGAAAALAVTRHGAQPSAPTASEIREMLRTGKVRTMRKGNATK